MEKRPTWKSTAFILTIVTQLITVLGAIQQYLKPEIAAVLSVILTAVFAACNAYLKVNAQPAIPLIDPPEAK